jgi:hypothetical protein
MLRLRPGLNPRTWVPKASTPVKLLVQQYNENTDQPFFDRKVRGGHTQEQTFAADHVQRKKNEFA